MIGKLIDLVLKLVEMRFGSRATLVRDLIALHEALQNCHEKYLVLEKVPPEDATAKAQAETEHEIATTRLIESLRGFEQLLTMLAPNDTWDTLTSYAKSEAQVHARNIMRELIELSFRDDKASDYETAINTLREYMRENLKPEEIYGKG